MEINYLKDLVTRPDKELFDFPGVKTYNYSGFTAIMANNLIFYPFKLIFFMNYQRKIENRYFTYFLIVFN
jgi:hypothetical protein